MIHVWRAVTNHVVLAGLTAVAVLVLAVVAVTLTPTRYTAEAVVAFVPRPGERPSGELVRLAVPTYASLATSDALVADVARTLDEDRRAVGAALRADNPPSTNTLLIAVTWTDPAVAADLTSEVVQQVIERTASDPLLTAFVVAPAVPPAAPSAPPVRALLVSSLALAVVAGAGAAVGADRLQSRRQVPSTPTSV